VGIKQQYPTEHPPEKGLQVMLLGFGFMTIGFGHTKLAQVIGVVVGHGVVVGGAMVVHGFPAPNACWLNKPRARR
jgi:hypothetical protein